jgi:hypothetical protein
MHGCARLLLPADPWLLLRCRCVVVEEDGAVDLAQFEPAGEEQDPARNPCHGGRERAAGANLAGGDEGAERCGEERCEGVPAVCRNSPESRQETAAAAAARGSRDGWVGICFQCLSFFSYLLLLSCFLFYSILFYSIL